MKHAVRCCLLWLCLAAIASPAAAEVTLYVSIAGENRIALYALDQESGELAHRGDVAVEGDPGPLTVDPQRKYLFASLREVGRIASFRIDPQTGGLEPIGTVAAQADPAYLATDRTGRFLLAAYYRAGKAAVHPIGPGGRLDEGSARWYPTAEKAHAILADPSNRFVFVPHTGPNAVFQFRFNADTGELTPNRPPRIETGDQTGPRHLWFHPHKDSVYIDNEQGSSVTAYRFDRDAGTLSPFQTLSTLPPGFQERNSCADLEMTPCGRFLYVSNRGHDSLARFAVDPESGRLTALGQTATEQTPRSFNIDPSGRFLYAAGESSGKLAAYRIDAESGALDRFATYEVGKQPWWVLAVERPDEETAWKRIAPFFAPPPELAGDYGDYRSPLKFDDGRPVETAADWAKRRQEILRKWHTIMGPWPPVIEQPQVEYLERQEREGFVQHTVRFEIAPGHRTRGYLLVPEASEAGKRAARPARRPAVLVVYYEPETAVGLKGENRDFALQLARRGFVTLSIGLGNSLYYPSREAAQLQPLSALAWGAANAWHVLAGRDDVDPERIGITGHSYGGKWAMFASCLYDRFACAAWSDGGTVFDEQRGNVNYWEPWYLGYDGPEFRPRGIPDETKPRNGAYKWLIDEGHDLHELHALMAPRPFLVSGGSEDPPRRWKALNHTVAVNRLLGHENRVAMTNRPTHSPTPESNEQMYAFFEHFLKDAPQRLTAGSAEPAATGWPQWRGPNRDGRAAAADVPRQWPQQLRKHWSIEVGEGHSSPVTAGDRVFQHARQNDHEIVRCLDLGTGDVVWSADYAAPYEMHSAARRHGKGPKSTPVVADSRLVTFGISGILSCFDAATGELLWQKEFSKRFKRTSPLYGTAMSPLVHRGLVIAHVGGHDDGALAAFDLATGEEKWAGTGDGPGYASPVVVAFGNTEQVVTQTQTAIVGVAPADGRLLWKVPFKTAYDQNSVTPLVYRDLLIVGGINEPTKALRLQETDGTWTAKEAWANPAIPLYMSSPIIAKDKLFGMTHRQRGALFCADPTNGQMHWTAEGRAGDNAALIAAGDQILALSTNGRLQVLETDPAAMNVAADYNFADTPTWAHPALTRGRLLIKDEHHLTCWSADDRETKGTLSD